MTILSIAQSAAVLCKMPKPSSLIGNSEVFESEMLECIQQAGDELARRHDWRALILKQDFATDGSSVLFNMPAGFHRLTGNNAVTYGTNGVIRGGLSDAEWRMYVRSSNTKPRFRQSGALIETFPAVSGADTPMSVQYVSSRWVLSGVTPSATIVSDSDTVVLPERLIVKGAVWRWKRLNKHAYQSELAEYEDDFDAEIMADGGLRVPVGRRKEVSVKKEAAA